MAIQFIICKSFVKSQNFVGFWRNWRGISVAKMQCMNGFLGGAKDFAAVEGKKLIILGNESCDLDSAISSMTLAFFLHMQHYRQQKKLQTIPVLNIPRKELPVKTEVTHFLRQKGILLDRLVCRDEINLEALKEKDLLEIILVDHHHSPWAPMASKVFDHRPFDPSTNIPESCEKRIELVGSCASLIADVILNDTEFEFKPEMAKFLYEVIILDTVNLSKEADKARELDIKMVEKIEELLDIKEPEKLRASILEELVKARSDISHLNSAQLLRKDLKIISNDNESCKRTCAIPGFPMLVTEFIKMDNAETAVKVFAGETGCDVILLMGMKVVNAQVTRDLALININDKKLFGKMLTALIDAEDLDLEVRLCHDFMDGEFFDQKNVKASRKQILPIAKKILDEYVEPKEPTQEEKEAEYQEFLGNLENEYKKIREDNN